MMAVEQPTPTFVVELSEAWSSVTVSVARVWLQSSTNAALLLLMKTSRSGDDGAVLSAPSLVDVAV
jgi:hypothetical protein